MVSNIDHKALEALLHGQGCANSLKILLENGEISSVSTEPLINTILDSFSLALSFVDSPNPPPYHESSSQNMARPMPRRSSKECYYRCTYAKDQNCNATKRVQKIKDNPPVYRTTYMGKHVCTASVGHDDTHSSKMIQFDQVVSELVMPQLTTIDHQVITMEDKVTDYIMNQECDIDINDYLVGYDQFWANQFPPFPSGDTMFLDNIAAFD
ncbi:unnamed protein product [Arabidopsis arenosa]|uniref:WRKY domain-containing protein n=1 Tax=Arabidopsis arenosa TaxID=38785 RepID=A0A8S1ZMW3_ARAAE|nr:unnamed protein product [Arabidopsis arenosa]